MTNATLLLSLALAQGYTLDPGSQLWQSLAVWSDEFGASADLAGDFALIGAPGKDHPGPATNADLGAAYVWRFDGSAWVEEALLMDEPAFQNSHSFVGFSVALAGEVAVLGAPGFDSFGRNGAGAILIHERAANGAWSQVDRVAPATLLAEDAFGFDVGCDGERVVVVASADDEAAPDAGAAYIYVRSPAGWVFEQKLVAPDAAAHDRMWSCAVEGDLAVLGVAEASAPAFRSGAVYVFRRQPVTGWTFQQKLVAGNGAAGDGFGRAVDLDGDTLVVGAPLTVAGTGSSSADAGTVYVFERNGVGPFAEVARFESPWNAPSVHFGHSVAVQGELMVVGALFASAPSPTGGGAAGAAHLFERRATGWQFAEYAFGSPLENLRSSASVAIGERHVVAGAPNSNLTGSAWAFAVREVFATYCDPAVITTAGTPAALVAYGSSWVAENDLSFTCTGMPAQVFGYLVAGDTIAFVPGSGGSFGDLCIGGTILRFNDFASSSGSSGSFDRSIDLQAVPVIGSFVPGQTWHFQAWFRDGARSNYSNAVILPFR